MTTGARGRESAVRAGMKPILVHVHVYYGEMWGELERCLRNLVAYPCEVYVTYVKDNESFESQVRAFGHGVKLIKVENVGYDIAPFLHVLQQVDLSNYSYVAKLHTKRDMPAHAWLARSDVSGPKWREYLLAPFSTPEVLERCLQALEAAPQLGVVAHHRIILNQRQDKTYAEANRLAGAFCAQHNISLQRGAFVAGSMFLCRAHPLVRLKEIARENALVFEKPDPRHARADLAHVLERVLGYIFTSAGMDVRDVFSTREERFLSVLHIIVWRIFRFIFQIKRTKHDRFIVKLLRIPVWWGKSRKEVCHE